MRMCVCYSLALHEDIYIHCACACACACARVCVCVCVCVCARACLKCDCHMKWKFHIVLSFKNDDEQTKRTWKSFFVLFSFFSLFLMTSLISNASKSLYFPYKKK